jgi:DNA-binding LytR/AlgR family response regulator
MKIIRTLIADDEHLARSRIRKGLVEFETIEVIGEARDGREAVQMIESLKPDLLLLDIQMPVMTGFEVLSQISHRPAIVFITAYDEYAIRAFEINATDYLLKPFTQERLSISIHRAFDQMSSGQEHAGKLDALLDYHRGKRRYLERITVKNKFEYEVFDIASVDFFAVESGLVFVYREGMKYQIDTPLYRLEENLDPQHFFRAHRKAIVNLQKVEKVVPWGRGRFVLQLPQKERVHLSREKIPAFKELMGLNV